MIEAAEYHALNAHIRELTAVRVALRREMVRIPFETPVERDEHGCMTGGGMPRPLYDAACKAIVEAEHAIMNIRDRNGWETAYKIGQAS